MDGIEFKEIRLRAGLTQGVLLGLLGIADRRSIRRWEAGQTPISGPVNRLMRLLDIYGVDALEELQ